MPRLAAIVLDSPDIASGRANFRIAFWYDVPTARQKFYAVKSPATITSAWIDALTADNAALTAGQVVEEIRIYEPDTAKSAGQMESDVAAIWAAGQARINALNKWPNYGSFLASDGATWTIVSVA